MAKKLRLAVLLSALMATFLLTAAQAFAAEEITSIDYIRADGTKEIVFEEYDRTHGYYRVDSDKKEYFYYTVNRSYGDKLILNISDGTSKTYKLSKYVNEDYDTVDGFINEGDSSDVIPASEVRSKFLTEQSKTHWVGGGTYELDIVYNGITLQEDQKIKIKIIDRTMESIEAEAREQLELHDSLDGSEFTKDSWYSYDKECKTLKEILDDQDHTEVALAKQMEVELDRVLSGLQYKEHYIPVDPANDQVITNGETIDASVDLKHRTKTVKFDCEEDGYYTFVTTVDNGETSWLNGRIVVYDDSSSKYVVLGNVETRDEKRNVSYRFSGKAGKIYYLQIGLDYPATPESFTVDIEKDNSMKSIEYVLQNGKTIEFEQYIDAEYNYTNNTYTYNYLNYMGDQGNDQIKCTYTDGSVKTYTYNEYRAFFVNDDDTSDVFEPVWDNVNQYADDEWGPGEHTLYMVFDDRYTVEVPVTIKPCSITAISFVPAKPYEFGTEEASEFAIYGEPYLYYVLPGSVEGDKLIVTKSGRNYTYVYKDEVDEGGTCYFYCEETGDIISSEYVHFIEDQENDHWLPNKDNYCTVEYYRNTCKVPVKIISDGLEELEEAKKAAQELLDKVSGVDQSKYTSATYGPFAAAKEALEDILEDSTADAGKIYAAIDVLQNAFDNLKTVEEEQAEEEKKQAVSTATTAAAEAAKLVESDYTEESFAPFREALDQLNALLADPDKATTAQINDAVARLETAKSNLVKPEPEPPVIEPVANTLKVTPSKKTYKLKVKLLKKKAYSAKPFKVTGAQGKVTYKATASGKSKKYLTFKSGKLKVKKGTKKGKYVITVKVTAAGNENYLPLTKSCKITVTVK